MTDNSNITFTNSVDESLEEGTYKIVLTPSDGEPFESVLHDGTAMDELKFLVQLGIFGDRDEEYNGFSVVESIIMSLYYAGEPQTVAMFAEITAEAEAQAEAEEADK